MLAEDETNSEKQEKEWLADDPLLHSYSDGFLGFVSRTYTSLHPVVKTVIQFLVIIVLPLRVRLRIQETTISSIIGTIYLDFVQLSWDIGLFLAPLVLLWLFLVSSPGLGLSYIRERNPERDIGLREAGFAVLLTLLFDILYPSMITLLIPNPIRPAVNPNIPYSGSSFGLMPILLFIVFPQFKTWVENLPTDEIRLENHDGKSLDMHRLSVLIFILLFFAPFLGVFVTGWYVQGLEFSLLSLCLICYFSKSVGAEFVVSPFVSMMYSLVFGAPLVFFAYRFIRYLVGRETRKRALRIGILSVAWSILMLSLGDLIASTPTPSIRIPMPVPLLVIFGVIAMYRPHALRFLFTKETQDEMQEIGPVIKPGEPVESRPEKVTIPIAYVVKSKLVTSRLNFWSDTSTRERAAE